MNGSVAVALAKNPQANVIALTINGKHLFTHGNPLCFWGFGSLTNEMNSVDCLGEWSLNLDGLPYPNAYNIATIEVTDLTEEEKAKYKEQLEPQLLKEARMRQN